MTRRSKSTAADNYATAAHARQRAKHDLDVASDAARTTADAVALLVRQQERGDEGFDPGALQVAQTKADRAELNVIRRSEQFAAARSNEARVLYRERGAQLAQADALVAEARATAARVIAQVYTAIEKAAEHRAEVVGYMKEELKALGMVVRFDETGITAPDGLDVSKLPYYLRVDAGKAPALVLRGEELRHLSATDEARSGIGEPFLILSPPSEPLTS